MLSTRLEGAFITPDKGIFMLELLRVMYFLSISLLIKARLSTLSDLWKGAAAGSSPTEAI